MKLSKEDERAYSASALAARRWVRKLYEGPNCKYPGPIRESVAFVAGATWQRSHAKRRAEKGSPKPIEFKMHTRDITYSAEEMERMVKAATVGPILAAKGAKKRKSR